LVRKYINRNINPQKKHDVSSEDELNKIDELNQNLNIQEIADVADRNIFLNDEPEKTPTHWERTKDATRNAMDRAGNTSQYMKYVNEHFVKQHSKIQEIKKLHDKFDQEVRLLRNSNDNSDDSSTTSEDKNNQNLINVKNSLLKEKNITSTYLNELKKEILKTEKNLQSLENQVNDVDEHIES
jgi:hypothetical protein